MVIGLLAFNLAYSAIQWRTTKINQEDGVCQLALNKIRVIINACHLDVEEEAEITTRGDVYWGDPKTLEIYGEFQLSPGSVMRSLLLWNGKKLLKAKLMDREKADSIFDTIVNYTYRDPAIVKYLGQNRYSFRIYPVAINYSRKVRILYSIPLQAKDQRVQFEVQPAFTLGAYYVPTTIPVEVVKSISAFDKYIIQHGATKKTIESGSTYLIPFSDFYKGYYDWSYFEPNQIFILPDQKVMQSAYSYKYVSANGSGNYAAAFSTVPDSLEQMIEEAVMPKYSIEAKIETKEKMYKIDMFNNSIFGMYLKSESPWDGTIFWNVYDKNGDLAIKYTQTLALDSDPVRNATLPLLWGAKYTLVEGLGDLGAIFGFVDNRMSLLALEKDTLSAVDKEKYWEQGVPALLPQEIIVNLNKIPPVPKENIIFELTENNSMPKDVTDCMQITLKPDNKILVSFNNLTVKNLKIAIYDIKGRLVKSFDTIKMNGNTTQLNLPAGLKGIYVIRVQADNAKFSKKLVLK